MEKITILVVEDNPGDARLIEEYLKMDTSANFSLFFTTTLADSLKVLSNQKFDVVLVDLGLPDSQGIYTFHEIINASPRSPIVIITGTDNENIGIEAIRDGAQNYLVKNQINSTLLTRTIKFAIEIKRKNTELKESREKYHSIFEGAATLIISISSSGSILDCNSRIQQLLGYSKDEVIGQPIQKLIHPESLEKAQMSIKKVFENGILCSENYKMTKKDGETIYVNIHSSALKDEDDKNVTASCIIEDITERIVNEKKEQFTAKILSILNRPNEWQKLIHDILAEISSFSGIEAVGIRHKEGEDYPYFNSFGFSDSFIKKENFLCVRNLKGEIVYDSNGKTTLECMCGNIISRRTDASLSYFTEAGSFWTNSTTNLLATTTDKERQTHTRNHCNAAGYESVALIPIISENTNIGLLQLNDKRKNMFTEEMIHFFEGIGLTLGIAFKRIKTEKLINEREEQYRRLFECARDGILILDADSGQILDANPFLVEKLGYTHAEFLSKKLWEVGPFADIAASKEGFEKLQKLEYVRYDDLPLETKSGQKYFVEFISNTYLTKKRKVIQCNIRDITERKQFEKALIAAKEKAEESDNLKSAFLANISHEIRTPMNGICGFTNLLGDPNLSENKKKDYISLINKCSVQLLNIINDLVDISKIEAGQIDVSSDEVSINLLLKDIIAINKSRVDEKNLEINLNLGLSDNECVVVTDKTKFQQILNNLINNAVKYTSQGSVNIGYNIIDNNIEFYIEDTGIGINPEFREKIFERFYKVEIGHTQFYEGTGLGLSITKAFIERMGGKIWLKPNLNSGSTFCFSLPYITVSKISKPKEADKRNLINWGNKTILVAEDDELSSIYLHELLIGSGANIVHAKNGQAAVDYCKTLSTIDIVLMDIKMPGMDGYEAIKIIKGICPDLPIIAQTAFAMSEDELKIKEAGADDFITKPINESQLFQKIVNLI